MRGYAAYSPDPDCSRGIAINKELPGTSLSGRPRTERSGGCESLRGSSTEEALETRAKKTTSSLRRLRGAVDENPCREIREERSNPRRRYVNEAEYATAYKAMPAGAVRHGTCRPDGPAARATSCP